MSDPERSYFEQEALARFNECPNAFERHKAFVDGAKFGADTIRRQRVANDKDRELLDFFAMEAMNGFLSCQSVPLPEKAAASAYLYADAMMAERARRLADG